jgi:hypothetical protein
MNIKSMLVHVFIHLLTTPTTPSFVPLPLLPFDQVVFQLRSYLQESLTESGWNDSVASVQQIEAKAQERQVAALKRERALAYAHTQQVWVNIWSHDLYSTIHASHPLKKFLPWGLRWLLIQGALY